MKIDAMTELWICNNPGEMLFHYPQSLAEDKKGLLPQFFSGIFNFMNDEQTKTKDKDEKSSFGALLKHKRNTHKRDCDNHNR